MKLLYAEDEKSMSEAVVDILTYHKYLVDAVYDGEEALDYALTEQYDGIILDIMMPSLDGFSVCRMAREMSDLPILFLTAKGTEEDKLRGYGYGADDYVTKPFSPKILLAKVNALLRRSGGIPQEIIQAGGISLFPYSRAVSVNGAEIELTHKEFELLHFFMQNKNQVFSREQLINRIWGYDFEGNTRTVDTHIKTLRQKLGSESRRIVTLIRSGYKFEV